MPNLDGAVLANIVQHLNPSVKILAMSGLRAAAARSKMRQVTGAFLFKPFKVEALLQAVNKLLHPELVTEVAVGAPAREAGRSNGPLPRRRPEVDPRGPVTVPRNCRLCRNFRFSNDGPTPWL